MNQRSDPRTQAAAAQAIERVLRAEQQAEADLAQVRLLAQARIDAARDEALALVNRAAGRVTTRQQRHAEALQRRLSALREQANAAATARALPDAAAIAAAVERVAAQLTGAADAGASDAAH